MQVFKTDKTYIMLRTETGKINHVEAQVVYSFEYETDAPDFDYGDAGENARELERFKSGECLCILLKVTINALGETGTDILGQVFVTAKNFEVDLLNTAAEHDMKNNAAGELINNIQYQYQILKQALA